MCDRQGNIYDLVYVPLPPSLLPLYYVGCGVTLSPGILGCRNIVPYLKKYGTSPVTGEKMKYKDLIKLNIFRNAQGMCIFLPAPSCPVQRR